MLLADTKGFKPRLPNLASLKRLLPATGEPDDDIDGFVSEELDAFSPARNLLNLPPRPAPKSEPVYADDDEDDIELPAPELFDAHEPNRNRTDLEELDPELEAVVASIDEDGDGQDYEDEDSEQEPETPAEAAAEDGDDLMSFFEATSEVSRTPQVLADSMVKVGTEELLTEALQLRALLGSERRD